jgi:hypothetical protein
MKVKMNEVVEGRRKEEWCRAQVLNSKGLFLSKWKMRFSDTTLVLVHCGPSSSVITTSLLNLLCLPTLIDRISTDNHGCTLFMLNVDYQVGIEIAILKLQQVSIWK